MSSYASLQFKYMIFHIWTCKSVILHSDERRMLSIYRQLVLEANTRYWIFFFEKPNAGINVFSCIIEFWLSPTANEINNYLNWPHAQWSFSGPVERNDETNNANEHSMVKNPKWLEADRVAIYKGLRKVELGFIEKKLQLSGQSRTWICDLRNSSPVP